MDFWKRSPSGSRKRRKWSQVAVGNGVIVGFSIKAVAINFGWPVGSLCCVAKASRF